MKRKLEFNIYETLDNADYDDEISWENNIINLTNVLMDGLFENTSCTEIIFDSDSTEDGEDGDNYEAWKLTAVFRALNEQPNSVVKLSIVAQNSLTKEDVETAEAMFALSSLLRNTQTITRFELHQEEDHSEEDIKLIGEALAVNQSMIIFDFGGSQPANLLSYILKGLQKNTSVVEARVDYGYDLIKNSDALVGLLRNNNTLVRLSTAALFSANKKFITLDEVKPIFDALKDNKTISHFCITDDCDTFVTQEVIDYLIKVLTHNKNLTTSFNFILHGNERDDNGNSEIAAILEKNRKHIEKVSNLLQKINDTTPNILDLASEKKYNLLKALRSIYEDENIKKIRVNTLKVLLTELDYTDDEKVREYAASHNLEELEDYNYNEENDNPLKYFGWGREQDSKILELTAAALRDKSIQEKTNNIF